MRKIICCFLAMILYVQAFGQEFLKENENAIVIFGHYEQDGNEKNGKEPLRWIVLHETKDWMILLCLYAIDMKPYNEKCIATSWTDCTLRFWLNHSFYNAAFTQDEQKKIQPYTTIDGSIYDDNVTLLTAKDVSMLDRSVSKCTITTYAKNKGTLEFENMCFWWTQDTSLFDGFKAITVSAEGVVEKEGTLVSYDFIGVRPVICIKK